MTDRAEFEPPDRASPLADGALMAFLQANRRRPVRISLARQRRADSRLLQLLLAAGAAWRAEGLSFDVAGLPPNLIKDFGRLGLNGDNTGWSGLP